MPATKEQRVQSLNMIQQWQQSGLSQKAFCASNDIAYHVFHYWYKVFKREQRSGGSFLPINIKPACSAEQIIIRSNNGIELQLPLTDQAALFVKQLLL